MVQIHIYVTEEMRDKLKEKSEQSGVPVAEMVRRAIDAYLKQPEVGLHLKYGQEQ